MASVTCSNTRISPGIASYIAAEYNLTQKIMAFKKEVINISTTWVKAHQDDKTAMELLPPDTQLNVQPDKDIAIFCQSTPDHLQPQSFTSQFPSMLAHITNDDVLIASKLQQWI
eukprot:12400250-Ditylum_brightwellii.AAC.1